MRAVHVLGPSRTVCRWFVVQMAMNRRTRQRYHHRLDPALRSAIARAAGAYGGRIGGPARALRMTKLERSIAAMRAVRARWAKTTTEERRAWSDYMRKHQRRFFDGRTLPRKPVRGRAPVAVGASSDSVQPGVSAPPAVHKPVPQPAPQPIPVVVMPHRVQEQPLPQPGVRYDI